MAQRLGKSPWLAQVSFFVEIVVVTEVLVIRLFIMLVAKRFQKQIFLSVDLPLGLGEGQQMVFEAEKGIVEALKAIEKGP